MITDEDSDEVKVFRRDADAEADDDPMIGAESSAEVDQQLADDKKAAVMEAESEGAAASGAAGGASTSGRTGVPLLNGIKADSSYVKQESPSFHHLIPGLMPGAFSPNYATLPLVMPFIMHNAYVRSPMFPMSAALSPSFPLMTSPYFQSMTAAAAKHQLENANPLQMRVGPLNQLNQMRMNPYMTGPGMMMPNGADPHHQQHQRRTNGGGKVKKEDHIKKPLNAFMWFMKENRKKLIDEIGPEKQSAELNKELGKRWHDLAKEEQAKYFDLAKKDRESHKEKYPQWSARENYAVHKKKTKKRRDKSIASENNELKKCRARFGVKRTDMWCKFCKRKKKCEYATDRSGDNADGHDGRGTSGACSDESSESPSPPGAAALPTPTLPMQLPPQMLAGIPPGLPPQQQQALMHQMIMQMQHLGSSSSLGPSPMASSSAGRTPPEDADASDSESDVDEDEEIDPTITQLTTDTMMQECI